jgi:hypothetical protein
MYILHIFISHQEESSGGFRSKIFLVWLRDLRSLVSLFLLLIWNMEDNVRNCCERAFVNMDRITDWRYLWQIECRFLSLHGMINSFHLAFEMVKLFHYNVLFDHLFVHWFLGSWMLWNSQIFHTSVHNLKSFIKVCRKIWSKNFRNGVVEGSERKECKK